MYILECLNHLDTFRVYLDAFHVYLDAFHVYLDAFNFKPFSCNSVSIK